MAKRVNDAQKWFWKITGFDGHRQIYEKTLPVGLVSDVKMLALLQRLASKHLDYDEIVSASVRRNAKMYAPLLEHFKDARRRFTLSVGHNPYFIAASYREDEL